MRSLSLLASCCLALLACTPSNGDGSVIAVPETEPNGSPAQATAVGGPGTYTYFGTCQLADPGDWFKAQTSGGELEASLYTSGSPAAPGHTLTAATAAIPTFALDSQALDVLGEASQVTAEANISGLASSAQTVYLEVRCPQTAIVYYYGTLRVP